MKTREVKEFSIASLLRKSIRAFPAFYIATLISGSVLHLGILAQLLLLDHELYRALWGNPVGSSSTKLFLVSNIIDLPGLAFQFFTILFPQAIIFQQRSAFRAITASFKLVAAHWPKVLVVFLLIVFSGLTEDLAILLSLDAKVSELIAILSTPLLTLFGFVFATALYIRVVSLHDIE